MRKALRLALALLLPLSAIQALGASPSAAESEGHVIRINVVVALVGADLQVRPVPKFRLGLIEERTLVRYEGVTGFDGKLEMAAPPGSYILESDEAIAFESHRYSWNIPIRVSDAPVRVELSNDNAHREPLETVRPAFTNEGELFKRVKGSVLTVLAEGGKGTGFLVDDRGLILTNHHVVAGSDFLSVKLEAGGKYRATLISDDPRHDVAVLLVNPEVVGGIKPLILAQSSGSQAPVSVGEHVLALGSPLSTEGIMTTGIVSKIESDAVISDVNINPGNSGGPLLNLRGEVIGITTFGVQDPGRGPGIGGIVRIHVAQSVLESGREKLGTTMMPSPDPLPLAPERPYPADALERLANPDFSPAEYHIEAGKIDVQFITPVGIASLEKHAEMLAVRQREKRQHKGKSTGETTQLSGAMAAPENGDGFYEWRRYVGDYKAIVRVQAIPEIAMTGGSIFAKAMLGASAPGRYRFKTDFMKMRLLRGGVEVAPIHPGKVRQVVSTRTGVDVMEDIGTFGAYEYSPDAFDPRENLVLEVYTEDHPDKPRVCAIDKILQMRIWQDFAPYFPSVESKSQDAVKP